MKKRFGFTLAEVLITLGIIGVVAAMTIPTLIANTNSARFRSQFKKTLSTLSQAGLMAQAQYDIDYSTPDQATSCSTDDDPNDVYTFCAIFNGTLSGHKLSDTAPTRLKGDGTEETYVAPFTVANAMYLTLADGSLVVFNNQAHNCHKGVTGHLGSGEDDTSTENVDSSCYGYIDVNGTTLPNRAVSCAATTGGGGAGFFGQPAYAQGGTEPAGGTTGNSAAAIATAYDGEDTCVVPNDANHMTDVFPIVFHDGTVEPLSRAARYVLTTAK